MQNNHHKAIKNTNQGWLNVGFIKERNQEPYLASQKH